eukprot:362349-Chlamydomonas_euryale.AAC.3
MCDAVPRACQCPILCSKVHNTFTDSPRCSSGIGATPASNSDALRGGVTRVPHFRTRARRRAPHVTFPVSPRPPALSRTRIQRRWTQSDPRQARCPITGTSSCGSCGCGGSIGRVRTQRHC